MNKVINITSNGIKEAIDNLLNENELLQDKVYKLESIIKEVREYIEDKYAVILADDLFLDHDERIERKRLLEIIEILDKENNNG